MTDVNQTFSFETYVVDSLKEINKKMDELGTVFVPRSEIMLMAKERDLRLKDLEDRLDSHRWYWRAVFSASAIAVLTAGAALVFHK